ncbi:MAG: lysophospholipid acyltransferase family protein [Candidatus Omnitrophica bacterium]|nr:lysophospholipid acyltransferase family protein [Candidatus Omnitrophota bacterium]
MLQFVVYKIGAFLAENLPRRIAYAISRFLFYLHYIFYFRDRRAVRNNLRQILGTGVNLYYPVKDVFRNFGIYIVEFLKMRKTYDAAFLKSNVKCENVHYLDEALRRGRGGIIVTAHIGNWELGAAFMSLLGYPLNVVALPHKSGLVNEFFNKQRESKGLRVISTQDAPRQCLKLLKENKILAIVAERDFTPEGELMDFLGRKAKIPKGAAFFAYKTKAAIIPAYLLREKEDKFILSIERPIYPDEALDKESSVKDLMSRYVLSLERKIRENPTQWLMFREFWAQ